MTESGALGGLISSIKVIATTFYFSNLLIHCSIFHNYNSLISNSQFFLMRSRPLFLRRPDFRLTYCIILRSISSSMIASRKYLLYVLFFVFLKCNIWYIFIGIPIAIMANCKSFQNRFPAAKRNGICGTLNGNKPILASLPRLINLIFLCTKLTLYLVVRFTFTIL